MIIEHVEVDITVKNKVYRSDVFKDRRGVYYVTVTGCIPHHGFGKACVDAITSLYNTKTYWITPKLISNFKEQANNHEKES